MADEIQLAPCPEVKAILRVTAIERSADARRTTVSYSYSLPRVAGASCAGLRYLPDAEARAVTLQTRQENGRVVASPSVGGTGVGITGADDVYGREAFEAKIRFAFRELGLTKLVNGYFDGNENSWEMQRKLGYRRVAEVPSRCMADGRQTIEHVTTLLRSDWEGREDQTSSRA